MLRKIYTPDHVYQITFPGRVYLQAGKPVVEPSLLNLVKVKATLPHRSKELPQGVEKVCHGQPPSALEPNRPGSLKVACYTPLTPGSGNFGAK
jgi:hypothetical protein